MNLLSFSRKKVDTGGSRVSGISSVFSDKFYSQSGIHIDFSKCFYEKRSCMLSEIIKDNIM